MVSWSTAPAFARWSRPPGKSASWYARTIFRVRAESCIVWLHVIGTAYFAYIFIFSPLIVARRTRQDEDYACNLFATRVFACCVCFACASIVLHRTFWPMSEMINKKGERFAHCGVALAIAGTGVPLALLTLRPTMTPVFICWFISACATAKVTRVLSCCTLSTEGRLVQMLYVACVVPTVGVLGVAINGVSGLGVSYVFFPFLMVGVRTSWRRLSSCDKNPTARV